jgi:transposase-like protein
MLKDKAPELLSGVVEIDETYVGGKVSNKHVSKRKQAGKFDNKTMVLGAVQRKGKVKTKVIPETTIENIQKAIPQFVAPNSIMVTDEHTAYNKVHLNYEHKTVNHGNKEYVRGDAHTNTIEGFWNVLKKQINGIHHSVSPKHLQRYCDEAGFRYNNRELTQDERFADALTQCEKRLTYKNLIAR